MALLAKQAVTFQEISDGRLEFRTGAGATPKYAVEWWHPYRRALDVLGHFDRFLIISYVPS